jgi:hypothetical protein
VTIISCIGAGGRKIAALPLATTSLKNAYFWMGTNQEKQGPTKKRRVKLVTEQPEIATLFHGNNNDSY